MKQRIALLLNEMEPVRKFAGHYNCGGVNAAPARQRSNLVITDKWLLRIKDVYRLHQNEFEALPGHEQHLNRLL